MTEKLTDEQLDGIVKKYAMWPDSHLLWAATELLALRADLARVEPDSVLADLLNERVRADALNAECVEAWRLFHLEKAKDGDVWKERALALRAERAKATQSDEDRARSILHGLPGVAYKEYAISAVEAAFDSIRAEATHDGWAACEAKYETLMPELRDSIRAEGSAERAKLEGAGWVDAITDARKLADEAAAGTFHEANTYWAEDLRNRLDGVIAALAQPAESGATFSDGCESMADLQAGAKSAESGATECPNCHGQEFGFGLYCEECAGAKP